MPTWLTAPGDLGLARPTSPGDLDIDGDLYARAVRGMSALSHATTCRWPRAAAGCCATLGGAAAADAAAAAAAGGAPRGCRLGLRHSKAPRRRGDPPPLRRVEPFYEWVLGPSMAYTCAVYPTEDATLEEAQYAKYDLVARKLGLKPGMRLLDVGCGWGGMVMHAAEHYGVQALGVTLSRAAGRVGAEGDRRGGPRPSSPRSATWTTATSPRPASTRSARSASPSTSAWRNCPSYFALPARQAAARRPAAQPLHHPPDDHEPAIDTARLHRPLRLPRRRADRLGHASSREMQDAGFEVRHEENLREHYAHDARGWCANLDEHWDEAVAEVGEGTARVWRLYMAGSRLGFERNKIQLHQVLGVKLDDDGRPACRCGRRSSRRSRAEPDAQGTYGRRGTGGRTPPVDSAARAVLTSQS